MSAGAVLPLIALLSHSDNTISDQVCGERGEAGRKRERRVGEEGSLITLLSHSDNTISDQVCGERGEAGRVRNRERRGQL